MDSVNLRAALDDYRDAEFHDCYVDPNGCCWDTASEMLVSSDALLGLCGCGLGTDFDYILGGLELVEDKCDSDERAAWDAWWERHKEKEKALFGNEAGAQFFYKWLDREGLSEHGGSVPGWLTDTGKRLLALMREAEKREATQDDAAAGARGQP